MPSVVFPQPCVDAVPTMPPPLDFQPTPQPPHNRQPITHVPSIRISQRIHKPPGYLQDYHCNHASFDPCSSSTMVLGTSSSTSYPLSHVLSYSNLSSQYKSFALIAFTIREPSNYKEASKSPYWCEAMTAEITALKANQTWSLTSLPPGKTPLVANGFIRSSLDLMVPLRGTRLDLLLKATTNKMALIILKHSHLLQSLSLLGAYLLLLL